LHKWKLHEWDEMTTVTWTTSEMLLLSYLDIEETFALFGRSAANDRDMLRRFTV